MDCTFKEVKSKNNNGSFKVHKLLEMTIHSKAKSRLTCTKLVSATNINRCENFVFVLGLVKPINSY